MTEKIQTSIQDILMDGISKPEVTKLQELTETVKNLSPEDQARCIEQPIMEEISLAINTHEGESQLALEMLKGELDKCSAPKNNIEASLPGKGYNELKAEFENNIIIPKMMLYFEKVFDSKLSKYEGIFTSSELSSIRLIMWGSNTNFSDTAGNLALQGIQGFFTGGAEKLKNEQEQLEGFFNGLTEFLEKCKKIKQTSPEVDLSNTAILDMIEQGESDPQKLIPKKTPQEVYSQIKQATKDMGEKTGDMTLTVEGLMEKAFGENLGEKFGEYLKDNPWITIILSMFGLGGLVEKYLDSDGQKRFASLKQLEELSKDSHSQIYGAIPDGFFKDFEIKNLDIFFTYLESQKIDYSSNTFWQELLSGKTQDEEIKNIHSLLKGEKESLLGKDDFKEGGKGMKSKLNNIQKLSQELVQKETQEEKASAIAALPPITTTTTETPSHQDALNPNTASTDTIDQPTTHLTESKEAPKPQANKLQTPELSPEDRQKFVAYRNLEIREALLSASSLPIEISYERSTDLDTLGIDIPKTIAFEGSNLLIDGKKYPIVISEVTHSQAKIQSIDIQNTSLSQEGLTFGVKAKYTAMGGFMSGEKQQDFTLTKNEFIEIFFSLLQDGKISKDIPKTGDITGGTYTIG